MPPRRAPRRHLHHHQDELVLRSVHVAAIREAFRAGENIGHLDGVAEERSRALAILKLAEELAIVPLAIALLDSRLTTDQALKALRSAPPSRQVS